MHDRDLYLIRLLCVLWSHKKSQQRYESCMCTSVAGLCQSMHALRCNFFYLQDRYTEQADPLEVSLF